MLRYQSKGGIIPRSSPSSPQYKERDSGMTVRVIRLRKRRSQLYSGDPTSSLEKQYIRDFPRQSQFQRFCPDITIRGGLLLLRPVWLGSRKHRLQPEPWYSFTHSATVISYDVHNTVKAGETHHPCAKEPYQPGKGKSVKNQTNDKTCITVMVEAWAMVCGNSESQEGYESRTQYMEVRYLSWLWATWD